MTFNCNTTLKGKVQAAATFAGKANTYFLSTNEPVAQNTKISHEEEARHIKQVSDKGYKLYSSKIQVVLIMDKLVARLTTTSIIA